MITFRAKVKNGFSLVEMVFYIAILSFMFVAVVQTLLIMLRAYGNFRASSHIQSSALVALDRVAREARDANALAAGGSFGSHPGVLVLDTTDAAGTARTVEFYVENGVLRLKENGVASGPLTANDVRVTNFVLQQINTGRSRGVKIELRLESGSGTALRSENFYHTVVLRDSY